MPTNESAYMLDNSAWHALHTNHVRFAIGKGLARRYPADMVDLVALANASDDALHDLAQIVEPNERVVLISTVDLPLDPPGWTVHARFAPVQMVCEQPVEGIVTAEEIVDLTGAFLPEIVRLVEQVHGVPFGQQTFELGHYIGLLREGKLVSMAGERTWLPGYREISSVATHPDYWGRGYSGALVSRLTAQNWRQGDISFLHVMPNNSRAQQLYERLNFRRRRNMVGLMISR